MLEFAERCNLMRVASSLTVLTVLRPSAPARMTRSSLRLYDDRGSTREIDQLRDEK